MHSKLVDLVDYMKKLEESADEARRNVEVATERLNDAQEALEQIDEERRNIMMEIEYVSGIFDEGDSRDETARE